MKLIIFFDLKELRTRCDGYLNLHNFESCSKITVEDVIRDGIIPDVKVHDAFLSDGEFFTLNPK